MEEEASPQRAPRAESGPLGDKSVAECRLKAITPGGLPVCHQIQRMASETLLSVGLREASRTRFGTASKCVRGPGKKRGMFTALLR